MTDTPDAPSPFPAAEYETASTLWSALGPLGTTYTVAKFLLDFGKSSALEKAMERVARELAALSANLRSLSQRLDSVSQRVVAAENKARVRALDEHALAFTTLTFRLQNPPGDRQRAADVANEVGLRLDQLLADTDLWNWSDVRIDRNPDGTPAYVPAEPDFKTDLALLVYTLGLATWVAAILSATAGDRQRITADYGASLQRHIDAVSVGPNWVDDGTDDHPSLMAKVRTRLTCRPAAHRTFAENGQCRFTVWFYDQFERKGRPLRDFTVEVEEVPGTPALCTIDPGVVLQDERAAENDHETVKTLLVWEEILRSVRSTGRMPAGPPEPGRFGPVQNVVRVSIYAVQGSNIYLFRQTGPPFGPNWIGPRLIGQNGGADQIIPAGFTAHWEIHDQTWLWYRNVGAEREPPEPTWIGGTGVDEPGRDREWINNRAILAGGDGIVYGTVLGDATQTTLVTWEDSGMPPTTQVRAGQLLWARHEDYLTGENGFGGVYGIGNGFDRYRWGLCCGKGVIYLVDPSGNLHWRRHAGYLTGAPTWRTVREPIGSGWTDYQRVFAAPDGVLFGVYPDGEMICHHHLDWETGGPRWADPVSVGTGWDQYTTLHAELPGSPPPFLR